MVKRYILLWTLTIILIGCAAAYLYNQPELLAPTPQPPSTDRTDLERYWKGEIETYGPERAHQRFVDYYQDQPTQSHLVAHVFGRLLFAEYGIAAIDICDESFGNGCYHQIVAEAFITDGPGALEALSNTCNSFSGELSGSCFHGIGHGLAEYHGHSNIPDALEGCADLSEYNGSPQACTRGVFMDYFTPSFASSPPFTEATQFAFCGSDTLSGDSQRECYYSLPKWWQREPTIGITDIPDLCSEVPDRFINDCFKGIGVDAPSGLDFNQTKIVELCSLAPTTASKNTCLTNSLSTFTSFDQDACELQIALGNSCDQ